MNRAILVAVFLAALLRVPAEAVTYKDLSVDARRAIAGIEDISVVTLNNGEEYEGYLISLPNAETTTVRVVRNNMSRTYQFPKGEVKSIAGKDVSADFAKTVVAIQLNPHKTTTKEELRRGIKLFDEFMEKCPARPEVREIKERRKTFQTELDALETGVVKMDGQTVTGLQAALRQCETDGEKFRILREQHPGIDAPGFAGSADAKKEFDAVDQRLKNATVTLPAQLMRMVPLALKQSNFKQASDDVDKMMKLWFTVIADDQARRRGTDRNTVLKEMDVSFLVNAQKQFMREYIAQGRGTGSMPRNLIPPRDMQYIPQGYFLMGRDGSKHGDNDFPVRLVYLEAFLIDMFEVRNKDYGEFVEYVQRTGDTSFEHPENPIYRDHKAKCADNPALNGDNQPVVGIDWYDAYAYAKWKKKRLPTEAEWEKAARGMQLRVYPWGKESPATRVVNNPSGRALLMAEMTSQVPLASPRKSLLQCVGLSKPPPPPSRSLPVQTWSVAEIWPPQVEQLKKEGFNGVKLNMSYSPYQLFHMAGNAAEWVGDWYDPAYYMLAPIFGPQGPESGKAHVYRGGSYLSPDGELMTTVRGTLEDEAKQRGCSKDGQPFIGFRCAKTIETKMLHK